MGTILDEIRKDIPDFSKHKDELDLSAVWTEEEEKEFRAEQRELQAYTQTEEYNFMKFPLLQHIDNSPSGKKYIKNTI